MKDRIAYMLDKNSENLFLGVVWIQGEQDSQDAHGHMEGFDMMTEDFFSFFSNKYPGRVYKGNWDRDVWYNVETVSHWYSQGQRSLIWENYFRWNPRTYVEIPRDTDSNEVNGTGLTAAVRACHFGNNAYIKVVAPVTAGQMIRNWNRK